MPHPKHSWRKTILSLLSYAALFYAALLIAVYAAQRSLMYGPDKTRITPASLNVTNAETIAVQTEDGLVLEGWHFPAKDPNKPIILWFHGNGSSHGHRSYRLPKYLDAGYGVVLAGYRGYGGNPGKPTEQGLYKDARAYISWLHDASKNIILYGESLGTGVATQMATEYDIKALILEAPYTSTADIAKRQYFFLPVDILMKDQYRSIEKITVINTPLLILHGSADSVIPAAYGQALYDAALQPKEVKVIQGAEHYDLYENGAALHVLNFLSTIESE